MIIYIRVASFYHKALFVVLGDYTDSSITDSGVRVDLFHANCFYRDAQWPLQQGMDSRPIHVETSRDYSPHNSNMRKEYHDTCTRGYVVQGWVG